jgi:RimK-like ATP-grasp domain
MAPVYERRCTSFSAAKMILVCGSANDRVIEYTCASLEHQKLKFRYVALSSYPPSFQIFWRRSSRSVIGRLSSSDWTLKCNEVSGAFVRYPDLSTCQMADYVPSESKAAVLNENNLALQAVLESLGCPVINPLSSILSNQSKPYQALLIRESGFRVPLSIVTNDLRESQDFVEACGGRVIAKPMHAGSDRIRAFSLTDLNDYDFSQRPPLHLQAIVTGDDIRVHTVGKRCFAVRIRSSELDYHTVERQHLKMEEISLPEEIAHACLRLSARLDLQLAGIDLKETDDGEYYCFEANPSPEFPFYEVSNKQRIASEIGLLLSGSIG